MEYQIILLPRKNYWDWVRSCREYVKHYGANLTDDPGTAARYMAPAQVISFPIVPGGFPEQADLEDWFQQQYPGIRLDAIQAGTPEELNVELDLRVEQQDRYGQKRRPFYLLWPTDYSVVTQPFGANPHIYTRFGMPGHEGIDIRALMNTNIYCCADGEVYLVHTNPKSHPYGIHVRIRHKDGYKTVYGHLAQPLVKEGQQVTAGQVLGKADSTGASTGSHLHLTLKRDGATKRGETVYPKDVIDPTPFMVWPERSRKTMPEPTWQEGKCLIGVHLRADGRYVDEDFDILQSIQPEAVAVSVREPASTIQRMKQVIPDLFILARISGGLAGDAVKPDQFTGLMSAFVKEHYQAGVRYFEISSDSNLQSHGYGRSWMSGFEFSGWFIEVLKEFRSQFPEAKFGYPGLSPGGELSGWRGGIWSFLNECEAAIDAADWIGVHAYWLDDLGMRAPTGGRIFEEYRRRYPGKLIFITEFNNPAASLTVRTRSEQYHAYLRMIRAEERIGAAFLFAVSSNEEGLSFILNKPNEERESWVGPLKASKD